MAIKNQKSRNVSIFSKLVMSSIFFSVEKIDWHLMCLTRLYVNLAHDTDKQVSAYLFYLIVR